EIASIPGVMNVAANSRPPLTFELLDAALREGAVDLFSDMVMTAWPTVSAEYFEMMRIPLRSGRFFRDEGETERVALVSESAARALWPNEDPIGKRLIRHFEANRMPWRVVG